ncbi:MAG: hypothetical protein QGG75_16735 [Alphaproteobacteria bacterium]|nr:hypothetical protein [Alphaproteobacteria bacterium]
MLFEESMVMARPLSSALGEAWRVHSSWPSLSYWVTKASIRPP